MSRPKNTGTANLGFEAELWAAADKMRGHMDAGEYKHVVLGLIFRKFVPPSQSRTLAELRDTPLPKLLSGEIRVKDAARQVEGAV